MTLSITRLAGNLTKKSVIKGDDAAKLLVRAEKDDAVTKTEMRAMGKVAALPDSRFERSGKDVHYRVDELRGSHAWAKRLLEAQLVVKSTVPGIRLSFDTKVTVERGDYGDAYYRQLTLEMKGQKAGKDGTLTFEYGKFKVSVPVKKGDSAANLFGKVERRLQRQQNGSMTVIGGFEADKRGNWSIGFGIHRIAPMNEVEKLKSERSALWTDLMIFRSEDAPDAIVGPLIKAIEELDAEIAAREGK